MFDYTYDTASQVDQILRVSTVLIDHHYLGPGVCRQRVYSVLDLNILRALKVEIGTCVGLIVSPLHGLI